MGVENAEKTFTAEKLPNVMSATFAYALSRYTGLNSSAFCICPRDSPKDRHAIFVECGDRPVKDYLEGSFDSYSKCLGTDLSDLSEITESASLIASLVLSYSDNMKSVTDDEVCLAASVTIDNGSFRLELYHSDRYSAQFSESFAEVFDRILSGLAVCQKLSQIEYLPDHDRKIIDSSNNSKTPPYRDFIEVCDEWAQNCPDNDFAVYEDRHYSNRKAKAVTGGIASELVRLGVKKGDPVGLFLPRSEWLVLAPVSILRAGAAYVPLDPNNPDERISAILEDCKAKVVITTAELADRIGTVKGDIIAVIAENTEEASFENVETTMSDLAMIVYTSGTTGRPKGVIHTRRMLNNIGSKHTEFYGLQEGDRASLFSSIGFVIHIMTMYPALYSGGCVDVMPEHIRSDMSAMNEYFKEHKIQDTIVSTSIAKSFISCITETPLRRMQMGGEPVGVLETPLLNIMYVGYGCTECPALTYYKLNKRSTQYVVGVLDGNTNAYILDAEGRSVPVGGVGTLHLSGHNMMLGYLNDETLNSQKIKPNQFSTGKEFDRMFNVGDMAMIMPDGTLSILGRRDGQVKIRGNRVELTEVEAAIRKSEYVSAVTVQALTRNKSSELVAYVVPKGDHPIDAEYIRDLVAKTEPSYMVPSFVVFLDSIPLNINGKVDRRALPKPDISANRNEYVAPRNDAEKEMCDICAEILGIEKIGIDDDFIELGGDSLKAIDLRNRLSYPVLVANILRLRTIRRISESLSDSEYDINKYTQETGCPLTESQLNVYLDQMANPMGSAYNNYSRIVLEGVSPEETEKILAAVIESYPILKCRIIVKDVSYLVCDSYPKITVNGLSGLVDPFEPDKHLVRFYLNPAEGGVIIDTVIHHTISDGLSMNILEKAIRSKMTEPTSPDLGFLRAAAYCDYLASSRYMDDAKAFFDKEFSDTDVDSGLIGDVDGKKGITAKRLSASKNSVNAFVREQGLTNGAFMTSVFAYVLSRFTGRSDAVFCTIDNGRDAVDLDNSIGMFVNTLPLHIDCSDTDIEAFLKTSSSKVYDTISHGHYPFRLLAKDYGLKVDIMFQIMSGFIDVAADNSAINDDQVNDLLINACDEGDNLTLHASHTDRYSENTVKRILDTYDIVLDAIVGKKIDRLSEIDCITESDIELTESFNKNEHGVRYPDIVTAFISHVRERPDAPYVTYKDKTLSYREADALTNAIAKELVSRGIGKGDCVASFVTRSEWYALSLFGIMKTGATYVPIDEAHPDERIGFIIKDTSAKAILVTPNTKERASMLSDADLIDVTQLEPAEFDAVDIDENDIALILYTSGTTGQPKGSLIPHRGPANYGEWSVSYFGTGHDDVIAMYVSYGFDMHMIPMTVAAFSGGCVDIIPEEVRLDMDLLNKHLLKQKVTETSLPTSVGKLFVPTQKNDVVKYIIIAGESSGDITTDQDYKLIDAYGPTEDFIVTVTDTKGRYLGSVGRVLYNAKVYILDKERRRIPYGAVGELYLSGRQLSTGYLNRPDANGKAFCNNPFCDDVNYRTMYASGDYARYLPDGTIQILGRRDGQVKIRGNRIELTEVEATIRSIEAVDNVTVQPIVNPNGGKELCAYIVVKEGQSLDLSEIRDYVSERKPEYMVPSYVVQLDKIPLNVNGKVDKRALPKPEVSVSAEMVKPRNDIERTLCAAFANSIGLEEVGIDDDFISLGGDSIKAIKVVSFCNTANIKVSATDVIKKRTVRKIVETIKVACNYDEVVGEVDMTPTMKLFMDNIRHKDLFDQSMLLKADEKIDPGFMQQAIDRLTDHHDMLRASLNDKIVIGGAGRSVCTISVKKVASENDIEGTISELRNTLDLKNGKMMACGVISTPENEYLFLSISCLVVDSISWKLLLDDLFSAYDALKNGTEVKMPSKTLAYPQWVKALSGYADEGRSKELEYWVRECESIAEHPSSDKGVRTLTMKFEVDSPSLKANPYCATEYELILTAFARAYCKIRSTDTLSVVMEGHGRGSFLGDIYRTVGWFTCVYPMSFGPIGEDISNDYWNVMNKYRTIPNHGIGYGVFRNKDGNEINRSLPDISFSYYSDFWGYSSHGFRSMNDSNADILGRKDLIVPGLSFNLFKKGNSVLAISNSDIGSDADDIADKLLEEFAVQLKMVAECCRDRMTNMQFACAPSIAVMNVILDESKSDMGNAYNAPDVLRIPGATVEKLKEAVSEVIRAHPALKARIARRGLDPWIICDSEPEIVIMDGKPDMVEFNRRFNTHKNVSRFWIVTEGDETYLMMNVHHVVTDNLSSGNLRKDIIKAYNGEKLKLDLGFIMASNFDIWSENSVEYSDARTFFNEMFADTDADPPTPEIGVETPSTINKELNLPSKIIDEFIRKMGTTKSSFFASAFAYTLAKFTGHRDSMFCFMENGRDRDELKDSIGMFSKILPVCMDCSDATVSEFIERSGKRMMGAITHDCYPFYEATRKLNITGSVQFQIVPSQNSLAVLDMWMDREELTDFDFNVMIDGDRYVLILICSTKYSEATATRFVDSFIKVVDGMITKERLSEIEYISDADKAVLEGYNDTAYPLVHGNILECFDEALAKNGDRVFVKYLGSSYTYKEADAVINRIASALVAEGVSKGDMVAVFVPRSEWYVLAPLAVIRAGAVYVPIDDSYPDERAIHMITDSGSKYVVALDDLIDRIKTLGLDLKIIDIENVKDGPQNSIDVAVEPLDPALVLYTSGTTGKPKGSLITHRAIVNMCEWYVGYTGMKETDCYGFYTSIAFDIHTMAVFAPIVCCASIDVVPEDVRLDMAGLNDHYVSRSVTHTFITTQVGKLFASSGFETTIRLLLYGGEKLGIFTAPDDIGACESYGPSENLSLSTAIYVNDRTDPSSVGYLLPNIKAYVLDSEKRMVPIGAVGELYLSGYQLSLGYLNREELNSKAFISNRYSGEKGYERIYATGDFFRWLPDGTLGIIGRRDGQLKIRGNRVELTEVDDVIRKYPGIKDVTVQPIISDTGAKELCAYIVPDGTCPVIVQEVKTFVSERKPAYMVPSYVMVLDNIPLTVNAKVDKRALPKPDLQSLRIEYVAPRNEIEEKLCESFATVLNLKTIGIDDDFISLGGDSIKAIRLLPLFSDKGITEMDITPADVLALRTVRSIMSKSFACTDIPELYDFANGCPLTDSQRSLYEYVKRDPQSCYNLPIAITDDSLGTDTVRVLGILKEYIRTCPITASRIGIRDGVPWMFFDKEPDIPVIRADPKEVTRTFVRPFDVDKDPLGRFAVCDWNGKITVLQDYHHLIYDGRSILATLNTLKRLAAGEQPPMDDGVLRMSAYDTVIKDSERYEHSRSIAESTIVGSCDDYLPYSRSNSAGNITRVLSAKGDSIRKFITDNTVSVTGFFSAVLGCTFTKMSGKDRCLFFLTEDGRGHLPLDDAVCLCAKGIPVSVHVGDNSLRDIVSDVSKHVFENMSYDEYAVWEMMRDYGVKWNIRLQYASFFKAGGLDINEKIHSLSNMDDVMTDIWIRIKETEDNFELFIVRSNRYSDKQIEQIADLFDRTVTEIVNNTRG